MRNLRFLKNIASVEKRLRRTASECLCPSCNQRAIRSHSQQRNGWLSAIAENGHVVGVCRQIAANLYQASPESPPPPRIDRIGLAEASTFWGYCNQHDTELFKCIEQHPLQKGSVEQVFALHLRAMSFERMAKQGQQEITRICPGWENEVLIRQRLYEADSMYRWNLLWIGDKINYFNEHFGYAWIVLPKNVGVSCATMIPPLSPLKEDRYMTAHMGKDGCYHIARPAFSLSLVPSCNETHVIMCWHNDDADLVAPWKYDLCNNSGSSLAMFLNRCVFVKSEDFYLRPSLWDSLDVCVRDLVRKNLVPSLSEREIPNVITI